MIAELRVVTELPLGLETKWVGLLSGVSSHTAPLLAGTKSVNLLRQDLGGDYEDIQSFEIG